MAALLRLLDSRVASRSDNAAQSVDGGKGTTVFGALLVFIAAVSVHDAMLVILNSAVISQFERNPIGQWLIDVANGEVWLFVLLKLTGTAVVCATLVALYEHSRHLGVTVTSALAVFQAGLLMYLCFW